MPKTNEAIRAVRATIQLGEKPVEVFQMPDGHYELSQSSSTLAVGKNEYSIRQFKQSKSPSALPYKELRLGKVLVEGHTTQISIVPIDYALAYWTKEASLPSPSAPSLKCAMKHLV